MPPCGIPTYKYLDGTLVGTIFAGTLFAPPIIVYAAHPLLADFRFTFPVQKQPYDERDPVERDFWVSKSPPCGSRAFVDTNGARKVNSRGYTRYVGINSTFFCLDIPTKVGTGSREYQSPPEADPSSGGKKSRSMTRLVELTEKMVDNSTR
ncbi:MAG TPA: hypothetical protein VIS48_05325 [Candidatus Kryptonia bacterium]